MSVMTEPGDREAPGKPDRVMWVVHSRRAERLLLQALLVHLDRLEPAHQGGAAVPGRMGAGGEDVVALERR